MTLRRSTGTSRFLGLALLAGILLPAASAARAASCEGGSSRRPACCCAPASGPLAERPTANRPVVSRGIPTDRDCCRVVPATPRTPQVEASERISSGTRNDLPSLVPASIAGGAHPGDFVSSLVAQSAVSPPGLIVSIRPLRI